jgi:hypothetical protein
MSANPPYYQPSDIADILSVPASRVREWIRRGELAAVQVSVSAKSRRPQYRVPADALERFEASRRAAADRTRKPKRNKRKYPQIV